MGNCCKPSSSMEWVGEDWESLRSKPESRKTKPYPSSSKVFDEASLDHHQKENDVLGKLRASCDASGKVTLKISKSELAELLGAIQQNNINSSNQQPKQQMKKKKELASAEEVLFRLMKAKDHEHHWKPVLETIPE
ncbi:hypothetical protein MtrunA17_Chr4g0074761 [Medicago truncatula]|uniref:Uncharacterized protein n=1 Tax=Medicago truncatula TaxID=3880 RepID=G7JJ62_MEDTR|nr:uncharacterized protein LOC11427121 [Medicago truncatula]AES92619.1 hypothetical protein MTR_4g132010 [Medicago truncatula]AFK45245.1 unknown [Medicago truncatula]RHN64961.1 hypothetical protein MtrunA17_Chr4g0074761 [Medicago truncatula]